jgi:polyhydroxybutyrate depolymerase
MFENRQTVAGAIKAFIRLRNIAQNASQHRVPLVAKWRESAALHGFVERVWYTNIGVSVACVRGAAGFQADHRNAGLPSVMFRSYRDLCLLLGICTGLLFFAGSGTAHAASGRVFIESGGVTRSAILVEHARLKKSRRPVIIILHSGGGGAGRVRHTLGLEERARSASPVMVYPEAIDHHWSDAAKPGDTHDAAFIHDLIAKLINEGIADRRRIFLVGASSGGMMALKLACSGADDFAGVVSIFATLPADLAATCKPAHPLPFLLLLGTADPFVPFNGGEANLVDIKTKLLSGRATLDFFAKVAGCGDSHTTTAFVDRQIEPSRAYLEKLNGCKVPVEFLRVEGGGHLLPRLSGLPSAVRAMDSEHAPGLRNRDVDGPTVIWDFLRHLGA